MFEFRYNQASKVYGEDLKIIYTGTDSFHIKYNMKREDLERKILENQDSFDCSNYAKDHPLC